MATLLALDVPLGPELEVVLRRCVDEGQAFCVLNQRLSTARQLEELRALGATHSHDASGRRRLDFGAEVDDEIGLVMLTSGSSGTPKAAELTWHALHASAQLTQATLRGDAPPVWFPCLPASHIGGLAVLLRAVLDEASLRWGDPRELSRAPERGATHVAIVRTQLFHHDVSQFDFVLLGGGRAPEGLPDNVITTWGMTETGSGVVYGGRPLPGVQVADVNGQLCVKTPTLFRSYRDSPRPCSEGPDGTNDWFPTGDGGNVRDGVVHVQGRLGFVINTGGEKVWPEELEAALRDVAGIIDVAVTSRDSNEWGQQIVAYIVSDNENLDQPLREAAAARIGPWAKPKEVHYVAAIPRTSNGKIRRHLLAAPPYLEG